MFFSIRFQSLMLVFIIFDIITCTPATGQKLNKNNGANNEDENNDDDDDESNDESYILSVSNDDDDETPAPEVGHLRWDL